MRLVLGWFLALATCAALPAVAVFPKMYSATGGGEALEAAQKSGKPIMIYFWQEHCTWCTVVEDLLRRSEVRFKLVEHYHFVNIDIHSKEPAVTGLKKMFSVKGTPAFAFLSPKAQPICMVYGNIKDDAELARIDTNVLALVAGASPQYVSHGFASCRGEVTEDDSKVTSAGAAR